MSPPATVKLEQPGPTPSPERPRGFAQVLRTTPVPIGRVSLTTVAVSATAARAPRGPERVEAAVPAARVELELDPEGLPPAGPDRRTRVLLELLSRELEAGPGLLAAGVNDLPFPMRASPPVASPDPRQEHLARCEAALALIERIQVFVQTARAPVLQLTLDNVLAARVEIERVGPRRVALRLVGQRGPPCPEAVSRVRDQLRASGLEVASISVA